MPLELTQPTGEYDEEHTFVPADVADGLETPEQTQERLRWEHEEYDREQYARNYAQHAHNQSSPSAYAHPPESEIHSSRSPDTGDRSDRSDRDSTAVERDERTPHVSPVPDNVTPGKAAQVSPVNLPRPSTPVRSAAVHIPRAATPTQSRPLGYHMNGNLSILPVSALITEGSSLH